MAQGTLVMKLDAAEQARLRDRLGQGAFEFRSVDHAHFSARGEGVVATLYRSGKLVVQGPSAEVFAVRYLDRLPEATPKSSGGDAPKVPAKGPLVGSDEAGKGDFFGPLVCVALRADEEGRRMLRELGVADSKTLSDVRVRRMAPVLADRFEHAVEELAPSEYNETHARERNLNPMLADLHARAIRRVARPGDVVLVDRFARESLVSDRLGDLDLRLFQEVRAEREPVVAAASILARATFLEALERLSEEFAVDLKKGAGAPTDAAGRRFVKLHGPERLERVAKLHFKNAGRVRGRS